ncbi:MAG: cytidine deaminase [Bacteroidales bacterium]
MKDKLITIKYKELASVNELSKEEQILFEKAIEATCGAYAPYSLFNVGAAVQLDNGEIISAANQENAAYPSGLCAERSTIFYAHSKYPNVPIVAIAIVAKVNGKLTATPTYPCGACRQVLSESQTRGKKPIKIIIGSAGKIEIIDSVNDLLPFAFDNLPI